MELSKYIKSESVELNRSAIRFADYNPRKLSDESRKALKRGIKKFGLVGGIVVNKRTGLTVVSGHQRLSVMDELQKFPDNDYRIRVDVIDVNEQQELCNKLCLHRRTHKSIPGSTLFLCSSEPAEV